MARTPDWRGNPIPPSHLQLLLRDSPFVRAYRTGAASRPGSSLATSFEDYLRADLRVKVARPGDILDFLRGCAYVRDIDQHGRPEVWMHPEDFERRRAGDCEDRALWAWIQFARLGLDSRFVAGMHEGGGHAWVALFGEGETLLCETTSRDEGGFLAPAGSRPEYEPVWSVDREARFYWHGPAQDGGIEFLEEDPPPAR